jgi:hypothetical protein
LLQEGRFKSALCVFTGAFSLSKETLIRHLEDPRKGQIAFGGSRIHGQWTVANLYSYTWQDLRESLETYKRQFGNDDCQNCAKIDGEICEVVMGVVRTKQE